MEERIMGDAITNKQGEDVIHTHLKRTTQGLLVTIKTHPNVEKFMQRLSGNNVMPVQSMGRNWLTEWTDPATGEKHMINPEPLRAYQFFTSIEPFRTNDGMWVNIDRLGHPLSEVTSESRSGMAEEQLNLSFLRLVGTSNPDGVKFLLRSVHSTGALRKLRDSIQNAQNIFYNDYIRTIEYVVTSATQVI
jgi:hypothetical protein